MVSDAGVAMVSPGGAGAAGVDQSHAVQPAPQLVCQHDSLAAPSRSTASEPPGAADAGISQDLVITHSYQLHAPPKPCEAAALQQAQAPGPGLRTARATDAASPWSRQRTARDAGRAPADLAERHRHDPRTGAGRGRAAAPLPHALTAMRALGMVADRPALTGPRDAPSPAAPASPKSRWQRARGAVVRVCLAAIWYNVSWLNCSSAHVLDPTQGYPQLAVRWKPERVNTLVRITPTSCCAVHST